MKVNLDTEKCYNYTVYLDGIKVDNATEADDIEGYVEFLEKDESLLFSFRDKELAKRRVYGRVFIEYKESEIDLLIPQLHIVKEINSIDKEVKEYIIRYLTSVVNKVNSKRNDFNDTEWLNAIKIIKNLKEK